MWGSFTRQGSNKADIGLTNINNVTWNHTAGTIGYVVTLTYSYKYKEVTDKMVRVREDGEWDWEEHEWKTVNVTHTVTVTATYFLELVEGEWKVVRAEGTSKDTWKNGYKDSEEEKFTPEGLVVVEFTGGRIKVNLTDLEPGVKCNITVQEQTETGVSAVAKTSAKTVAYTAPKGLKAKAAPNTYDSFTVNWKASPFKETIAYMVMVYPTLKKFSFRDEGERETWTEGGEEKAKEYYFIPDPDDTGKLVETNGAAGPIKPGGLTAVNIGTNESPLWAMTFDDLESNRSYVVQVCAIAGGGVKSKFAKTSVKTRKEPGSGRDRDWG